MLGLEITQSHTKQEHIFIGSKPSKDAIETQGKRCLDEVSFLPLIFLENLY